MMLVECVQPFCSFYPSTSSTPSTYSPSCSPAEIISVVMKIRHKRCACVLHIEHSYFEYYRCCAHSSTIRSLSPTLLLLPFGSKLRYPPLSRRRHMFHQDKKQVPLYFQYCCHLGSPVIYRALLHLVHSPVTSLLLTMWTD